ncbi:hypothetical protein BKA65DRAFT_41817 [Rhexocercosporidium sp. MPI-PUGE-AT-0058]|nr:hypothetical protein BKA65DRAFT_41817 [Rhexocercosporidium sp. MPI-PUGE-AT-0058]
MLLPRTTLFHTPPSTAQQPPSSEPSSSWSFTSSLPVSYRVAIFLDASILLLTLAILIGAILYIRNRRPAPHNHDHTHDRNRNHNVKTRNRVGILRSRMSSEEEETLLQSKETYSDERSVSVQEVSGRARCRSRSTSKSTADREIGGFVIGGGAAGAGIVRGAGDKEKKKKGHVRWTPSVQGGEAFGIPEVGGKSKQGVDGKKCKCRGRRHPGCWRFEMKFEGVKPILGMEREEGLGR